MRWMLILYRVSPDSGIGMALGVALKVKGIPYRRAIVKYTPTS